MKTTVAFLQGDPAGIGPELTVKLLSTPNLCQQLGVSILLITDLDVLARAEEQTGLKVPARPLQNVDDLRQAAEPTLFVMSLPLGEPTGYTQGQTSATGGRSSLNNMQAGLDLYRNGDVHGLCFMPFNKASMHLGGNQHSDEVGFVRAYFDLQDDTAGEFNVVDGLWNGRVTSHVPLREVADLITKDRVLRGIRLAQRALTKAGVERPRIAVAGLNPHAGDEGLLGTEEIEHIKPAIAEAQCEGINVTGPLPGDTVYIRARAGEFDCVLSMYHDQGQVAIKLLGFDRGITVHAGLPLPFVTPAHGTAFDIVGQNRANPEPSWNALRTCVAMALRQAQEQTGGQNQ